MIRKILLMMALTGTCFYLSGCVSDSEPSLDDDISAAAESSADEPADASASDQSAVAPDNSGATDDLSNDLDDSKQAATSNSPAEDEQSLENELDNADAADSGLAQDGQNAGQEPDLEPDLNTEPINPPGQEAQTQEVVPESTPAPSKIRVTNIRYLANQAGGTVVVEATGPLTYHTRSENGNFVIEIENAEIPAKLAHGYPMRDYSGAFANMTAEQTAPNQARITVQMKGSANGEPIVQLEGNSLLVVPASVPAPMVAQRSSPTGAVSDATSTEGAPLAAHTLDEFLTGNQKFYGKPISVQTKDADVRDVINFISEESGANIVMSDDVKGRVSLKVRKIPWDQALVSVMRTKKLGYVRQGNVIRISSLLELQEESDQAVKMIETQRNLAPVKVKVIPINYANVEDLAKQASSFLSKEGKAVADTRSSTVLITDRQNVLDRVETIIKSLDIAPNQVLIEGKIVEATETFSSFIGVNWGFTGIPTTISPGGGYGGQPIQVNPSLNSTMNDTVNSHKLFNAGFRIGQLDYFGNLSAALALEEKDGLVKVIASPRISVMNKEKAEITQSGEQVSIQTTLNPVSNDRTTMEKRTPMVLSLVVQPQITSDNSVIMDVEMKRQFPGTEVDETTHAAPVNTRTAKTKILVRNGQTSVIGGIYQDTESDSENGVPGLKDIPVLGWLFKSKTKLKDKNELLIFLTPRILQQQQMAQDMSNGANG